MADTPQVKGVDKLKRRIATIRDRLQIGPMVDEIADLLEARTKRRFDREVDPDENPWKDLAPATKRRKEQLGFGSKGKLKRTERLRNSIKRIRQSAGSVYTNTGAQVRIGINDPAVVPYARAQNDGTNKIPARRFLGIGNLDVKAVDGFMRRKAKQLEREIA